MDSKLPDTGMSIFAVMTQLANDCGAINLAQGFPSFNPDERLLELANKHLHAGANQYAPMSGVPALRHAIAKKTADLYGRQIDADTEITVCDGATEGLFSTIQAVVGSGDEVIVFDPAYDSYEPAVTLAGGVTRHLPLVITRDRPDFHIDWQQLAQSINSRTRLIILNFPQNPTGVILTADDLDALAEVTRDTSIYLLSDEVYEHIIFDDQAHQSLACHDELWQRTFIVSSFGKTYHVTGWKVGYCIAPSKLMAEFRNIHQWACYSVVTPLQHALADFMTLTPEHYRELPRFYEKKRDRFCDLVRNSRFTFTPAAGTFFQVLDFSEISEEDDVNYSRRLTREIGVASIPVSVFCEQPPPGRKLRFCFAKDDAILEEAAGKLCQL
ncbi:MAG: aminotransferase class I/II-fold pyridoxal phosphate-dependent enzyme [Gammaproteobacteria bacterium]|nr:aminotransferase class I/II-fold pyridoxal phosphate-dependent enzyme [Gammaproteobacteria bacterium]